MLDANNSGPPQASLLLDVVQDLLDQEAKRDDAANARAIAVVALSGVMLALTATISAGVLKAGMDQGWRVVALVLLTTGIAALLAATASAMFGVLRPRRFAMLATQEIKKFTTPEYLDRPDDANREVLLVGSVEILEHERGRSARKATWLRRSYALILAAVIALALTGVLSAFRAAAIIPVRHGERRPATPSSAALRVRTAAGATSEAAAAAPADRVRREGPA